MLLKKLLDKIDLEMVQWDSAWEETDIRSVGILSEVAIMKPGVLYIGTSAGISEEVIPGTTFICCKCHARPCPPTGQRNVFSTVEDFSTLLDRLYGIFDDSVHMAQCMERLIEKSSAGLGIQSLLEELYSLTAVPVFLVDPQYHPIGYNQGILSYPDFAQAIDKRILPERRIRNINRVDLKQAFEKYDDLFFMWAEMEQEYILVTMLQIGGMEAGHFIAFVGKDDPLKYYRLISFTCHLLELELQKNVFFQHNEGVLEAQFLHHLLEDTLTPREQQAFLDRLGWKAGLTYRILLVAQRDKDLNRTAAERIIREIASCAKPSYSIFYSGYLVIVSVIEDRNIERSVKPMLIRFGLLCSISPDFSDLSRTSTMYNLTKDAIRYLLNGEFEGPVIRYSECLYRIMRDELRKNCDISQFLHSGVCKIYDNDRQKHGDMIQTLAAYLEYNNDPDTAAKELHIHRNTLYYRIHKLESEYGLNLGSGVERMHILLTLEFLKETK